MVRRFTATHAWLWFVCAALLTGCMVVPPLSRSVPPPATTLPRPVPRPPPTYPAPVSPPAPTVPPPALTAPAEIPPPIYAEGEQPLPQLPQGQVLPTPVPLGNEIALVLPLDSAAYGRPAQAVREGFFAAEKAAGGSGARTRVVTHGEDGVLNAVAHATESNVALVVGPLVRDDVKTAITLAPAHPRMLVLNQVDDISSLPADVYSLTLSIDSDAAQLEALARGESARSAAIIVGDTPLQRRFSAAFAAAWRRDGGTPPREYRFDANPEQLGRLRRELAAKPPDAILLAVDGNDAALAKSFLPPVPVFAISQITDGLPLAMLRDLEGVRYVEIPWLADPGAPQFANVPRANFGDPVLERLYALGLDAFAIAQLIAEPVSPDRIELDGATGHLSLTAAHSFQRDGRVMVIRAGQIVPYESPR